MSLLKGIEGEFGDNCVKLAADRAARVSTINQLNELDEGIRLRMNISSDNVEN